MKSTTEPITQTPQDRYWSLDEIARRWGTSNMAPYRAVISGRLLANNFGQGKRRALWRVLQSDLEEYERQSSTGQR